MPDASWSIDSKSVMRELDTNVQLAERAERLGKPAGLR
jgi:hypothetical protein